MNGPRSYGHLAKARPEQTLECQRGGKVRTTVGSLAFHDILDR